MLVLLASEEGLVLPVVVVAFWARRAFHAAMFTLKRWRRSWLSSTTRLAWRLRVR
jgi:hypothetical protein